MKAHGHDADVASWHIWKSYLCTVLYGYVNKLVFKVTVILSLL